MKKSKGHFFSNFRMKDFKHNNLPECILILLFTLSFVSYLPAQESKVQDYPIHSGTSEWGNLKTYKEKLNALNIPDSLLLKMSTKDLVITCLNYPYWILITSRDNNQSGYNYIRSVFNGFVELELRVDACKELLNIYQKMNPDEIVLLKTNVERGRFIFKFVFIEALISQYSILRNCSINDRIDVMRTSLNNYDKKLKGSHRYSSFSLSATCLMLSRAFSLTNSEIYRILLNQNPKLTDFVEKGSIQPNDLLDRIATSSSEYLKQIVYE